MKYWYLAGCGVLAVAIGASAMTGAATYVDVLASPASSITSSNANALIGVAAAGRHLVAVGVRGTIVVSDARGGNWKQMAVPLSSDLVAVYFPTPKMGWAVGHDGVVLHSQDGGQSWRKQFDGATANRLMQERYQSRQEHGDPQAAALLKEAQQLVQSGPDLPLLDVWFKNEHEGYVVGAFNSIFRTQDGGQHWEPLNDLTDNPKRLHLYSIRGYGDELYIAGELGLLLRLNRTTQRFEALPSPYNGTFFGLIVEADRVLAFGLRGHAFASTDQGMNWNALQTGTNTSFAGGVALADGKVILLTQSGELLACPPAGLQCGAPFSVVPGAMFGLAAAGQQLALVGADGVHVVSAK